MKNLHALHIVLAAWLYGMQQQETLPPPAPVISVYGSTSCRFCKKLEKAVEEDCDRDWKIYNNPQDHPSFVKEIFRTDKSAGYPVIVWRAKSGRLVYCCGWKSLPEFLKSWEATQK